MLLNMGTTQNVSVRTPPLAINPGRKSSGNALKSEASSSPRVNLGETI